MSAHLVDDRFELLEKVGHGMSGEVWRAIDRASESPVALKLFHDEAEAVARVSREIRSLQTLHHPHLVRYLAHGTTAEGALYVALEWLAGEVLHDRLDRGPMAPRDAVELGLRLADALAAVHREGLVHRDVKPDNILLLHGDPAQPKLLDFGLVRATHASLVTTPGMVLGTPGFLSPEQARGEVALDGKTDVFSLGCVLYFALTGQQPFAADTPIGATVRVLFEEPPAPSTLVRLPSTLEKLVLRMLDKRVYERPSAEQVASMLEAESIDAATAAALVESGAPGGELTDQERRLVSAVVATGAGARGAVPSSATDEVVALGGRVAMLADGSLVAVIAGDAAPRASGARDHVAIAARCALSLRRALPAVPISVATGRTELKEVTRFDSVVSRAASLIDPARPSDMRIDEATASLLDARFVVAGDGSSHVLVGEQDPYERERRFLGAARPCLGRDDELAALLTAYERCVEGAGATVALVVGEAGMGKSRLRLELLRTLWATGRRASVLFARAEATASPAPLSLVVPALARSFGLEAGDSTEVRRNKVRARVSALLEGDGAGRVSTFLGELVGARWSNEERPELESLRTHPALFFDRARGAWLEYVGAELATRPLIVVLEDLHWADLPSVRYVEDALRVHRKHPLFVLALARPGVEARLVEPLARAELVRIELRGLAPEACEELARRALGREVSEAELADVTHAAGGNPLHLEELVRARAAGSELCDTVLAMLQFRLGALREDLRRVVRAASVFGEVVPMDGLRAVVGDALASKLPALTDELARMELLLPDASSETSRGARALAFPHALVRDAAYEMLTDADRQVGHRLVGRFLVASGERDAARIAEHLSLAGDEGAALPFLVTAADQAYDAHDFEAAFARAARALEAGASPGLVGRLKLRQLEALSWHSEWDRALPLGREVIEMLPWASPEQCRAIAAMVSPVLRVGSPADLAWLFATVRDILDQGTCHPAAVAASARLAEQCYTFGKLTEGALMLEQAERALEREESGEPLCRGRVHLARAWRLHLAGELEASVACYPPAVAEFERGGDHRNALVAHVNAASTAKEIGDYEGAAEELGRALVFEHLGLQYITYVAKQNLVMVLGRLGRLDEAVRVGEDVLAYYAAQPDPRHEVGARGYLAWVEGERGNLDEMMFHAGVGAQTRESNMAPFADAVLAMALLRAGRLVEALVSSTRGFETAERDAPLEEGEAYVRLAHAECLYASGRAAEAEAVLLAARTVVLDRARRFSTESGRDRFLRIAEHRRILELAGTFRAH